MKKFKALMLVLTLAVAFGFGEAAAVSNNQPVAFVGWH